MVGARTFEVGVTLLPLCYYCTDSTDMKQIADTAQQRKYNKYKKK
jgi:hypothetical protein